jgi:hypothetical protein
MLIADGATTATAIFAAVAALAAWATVATDRLRQRAARQPNVSVGFLSSRTSGNTAVELVKERAAIEFINMGPGLAIQLAYLLNGGGPGGQRQGSLVGAGHLQAGERQQVAVQIAVHGDAVALVWACRDIDQRLHVWSYSGQHTRLRKGEYPNLGECFRMMYPEVMLLPRNVGAVEDPTVPGE